MSERPQPEALAKDIQVNATTILENTSDQKARSALLRDAGLLSVHNPSDGQYVEQVQQALKASNIPKWEERGSGMGISVYPSHIEIVESLPGKHPAANFYEGRDESVPNYRAVIATYGDLTILENDREKK